MSNVTDETQPKTVLIERDGMTTPLGSESYLKTWNGLKYTLNVGVLKTLAFPLALMIGTAIYFGDHGHGIDLTGAALDPPGITLSVPVVDSKILVEQDLVNVIHTKKVDVSPLGHIQVFNMSSLTEIPVGSEAKALLVSGASNGIVKARLVTAMQVDGEPVIPEGATVFGHGKSTEERLFVEFTHVIFPSGDAYPIRAQAFDDSDKILGLKGAVVGSKTKKMALGMTLGFVGGMADGLQDTSGSVFDMGRKRSVKDAALSGAAKATLDQSQMELDQVRNAPEIIEVKQGTEFYLIVDEPKKSKEERDN